MKNIFFLLVLFFTGTAVFAQGKLTDEKRKEFEAQKVAFFTQELDLTPAEAATFWPLYNEMRKKIEQIEGGMRKRNQTIRENKNIKQSDYREAVLQGLSDQQSIASTKDLYIRKMLEVIPASKVWRIEQAERKFHRQLFDKLRRESANRK